MEDIDPLKFDFLQSYSEDEGEGLLPPFGGTLMDPTAPEQVTSSKLEGTKKPKHNRRSPKVPWKKPKDMPRHPLLVYNLFFQRERERLVRNSGKMADSNDPTSPIAARVTYSDCVRNHKNGMKGKVKDSEEGKGHAHLKSSGIGFANLAKTIASEWKQIDPNDRAEFEVLAATEKDRYNKEMAVWWNKKKVEKQINERAHSFDELRSSLLSAWRSKSVLLSNLHEKAL